MGIKAILNGTIVQRDQQVRADILLKNGDIAALLPPDSYEARPGDEIVDASGQLVLPGGIDIHFHCRAPAFPERGDFATETRAAAAGGITTVFEMPISKPCASTLAVFENRRRAGEASVYVDFGLYAAPASMDRAEVAKMVEAGAIGFKIFMVDAPPNREDEFNGLVAHADDDLFRVLEVIKAHDIPAVFHCESEPLLQLYSKRLDELPEIKPSHHAISRPPIVESLAIARLITLAEHFDRRVHIAHMSSAAGAAYVRDAKRRGVPVTAETCPHYLLFTSEKLDQFGPFAKMNPPLRDAKEQAALWAALDDGTIDVIGSDHAPFAFHEKEAGWADIRQAPPGVPGIEILYHFVLDQALQGRFSLGHAVELLSTRPAKMYGLYPRKGIIEAGAQADLVIFDPQATTVVDGSRWQSKAADCERLYTGLTLRGAIRQTILRGETVYRDGEIVGRAGGGRFVRPIKQVTKPGPITA